MSDTVTTTANEAATKPPSVTKLFTERMRREGREAEFKKTLADVRAKTKQGYGQAKWEAMRRCGYRGPEVERALHENWLAAQSEDVEYADIPTITHPQIELEWVLSHDILSRKRDPSTSFQLTHDDYLRPWHGPAPSIFAMVLLDYMRDLIIGKDLEERQLEILEALNKCEAVAAFNNVPYARWIRQDSCAT